MEDLGLYPVKTSDLGFHGNLFGGMLLTWADLSGVGYAMKLCGEARMLTHTIEHCHFLKPAKEGELVSFHGFPWRLGTSSLTIAIEARSFNPETNHRNTILRICSMRFVCVDAQGLPTAIGQTGRARIQERMRLVDHDKANQSVMHALLDTSFCSQFLITGSPHLEGTGGDGI